MKEYNEDYSISKIVGVAPGYVGYEDKVSFLDKIKLKSFNVILLEDIDKCSKNIFDLFSKAFENGFFTNSKGESICISNCLFFMTMTVNSRNLGFVENKDSLGERFLNNKFKVISFNNITEKDIDKYIENTATLVAVFLSPSFYIAHPKTLFIHTCSHPSSKSTSPKVSNPCFL